MSEDASQAQEIIAAYPRLLFENYCIIASSALLWFDLVLTLPDEYQRIWRRKLSGATVVYLLTRYIAAIERIFFVLEVLVWKSSRVSARDRHWSFIHPLPSCGVITHTDDVLLFLNYLAFSAFTTLGVYGVWGRDWKPLLLVLPLSLVRPIFLMYENVNYVPVQGGPPFGCVDMSYLSEETLSVWVITVSVTANTAIITADVVLIILTWVKAFSIKRHLLRTGMPTPLATLLLRDGTAYFVAVTSLRLITLISYERGDQLIFWLVWPYFEQVFIVIFLSRFLLNLRGLYFADQHGTTSLRLSDVEFRSFSAGIVGNLGATLRTTSSVSMNIGAHDPTVPATSSGGLDRDHDHDTDDEVSASCLDPFKAGLTETNAPPVLVMEGVETQPVIETRLSLDSIRASSAEDFVAQLSQDSQPPCWALSTASRSPLQQPC
ncbi:hypothetical protein OH77DRAFT_1523650 [Trametes cingulata]|nr:hypothetical protein OH77DRAFT_1523650 [Trametes cingulata]